MPKKRQKLFIYDILLINGIFWLLWRLIDQIVLVEVIFYRTTSIRLKLHRTR